MSERLSILPAYVRASKTTTLPSRVLANQWCTKFEPMKPAPPVMNRLRGSKLIQHHPQIVPPMNRGQLEQRPRRRAIQNAERRSLCLRGVLAAVNRQYRYRAGKEASRERLILNRHREVVPTCHTQIGPVINSGRRLRVDEAPNGRGSACRPSRRTDLVADDVYLLLFTHQTQHRQDKVLPFGGVYPRCAQHDSRTTRNHMTLATEFADPVDAQRVSVVGWLVGAFRSTIEHKIRGQVQQLGPCGGRCSNQRSHGRIVDGNRLRSFVFGEIDGRIRCRVDDPICLKLRQRTCESAI